jgi:hypothetical protein
MPPSAASAAIHRLGCSPRAPGVSAARGQARAPRAPNRPDPRRPLDGADDAFERGGSRVPVQFRLVGVLPPPLPPPAYADLLGATSARAMQPRTPQRPHLQTLGSPQSADPRWPSRYQPGLKTPHRAQRARRCDAQVQDFARLPTLARDSGEQPNELAFCCAEPVERASLMLPPHELESETQFSRDVTAPAATPRLCRAELPSR